MEVRNSSTGYGLEYEDDFGNVFEAPDEVLAIYKEWRMHKGYAPVQNNFIDETQFIRGLETALYCIGWKIDRVGRYNKGGLIPKNW